ncbi:MAG: ABC transporter permease [Acidimicrobiales bacterium]|nr:ABC transporter permease [Acidimicrobiales bacterium]
MTGTTLVGTGRLVRLILRRDRVRLPLWVAGLIGLMAVSASQVQALYDTPAKIIGYTSTMRDNPALVIFAGPGYGFDDPGVGVILVNETSLWMALGCALMSVFLVNRHTRAEEESERADLLRSTVVGRHATISAALIVALMANVVVTASTTVLTTAVGYGFAGSLALCGSFGMVGVAFAAVTAVAAQLASTGRAALGLGAALAGLAFIARGIGDISTSWLAWLSWSSPFGWAIGVRAFAGERWWAIALLAAFSLAVTAAAFELSVRRDLGSGMLTQRAGPARAPRWSTTPLGLAFRLQRGALLGWTVGVFVTAAVYGSVGNQIEQMLEDNPQLKDYFAALQGASITDVYLSTALRMMAMLVMGFSLSSVLRNRSEETAGYAESMLATATSRWWWVGSHLVVTVAGTVVVLAASGLGVGLGYALVIGDAAQVPRMLGASLALLPALLVVIGLAVLLFGWLPRATVAVWGALAAVVVIGIFGDVLRLPGWVRDLSPLQHVPALPARPWQTLPIAVLGAAAVVLTAAGLVGFRRRDLTGA